VRDDGFPSLSATGRVTVVVNEVNSPPTLGVITNRTVNEGKLLTFTADANDNDLPRQTLTFSLNTSAPAGATIDPATGIFAWRPTEFQGGKTNRISVIVHDSSTPSLSATQTFDVRVRDTQGDFILAIGSTNLFTGETNSVALTLQTGTELTDISFVIGADAARLSGLSLGSIAPEIASSTLQPFGTNQSRVQLTARPGDELLGSLTLARLNFTALSNQHSAIVPLRFTEARATQPNGNLLSRPKTADGRVFIIGEEPILDAVLETNGARTLVLYARPERHYTIESNTNLASADSWSAWQEIDLLGRWARLPNPGNGGSTVFYRAVSQPPGSNGLTIRLEADRLVIEWPLQYEGCLLEKTSPLNPPVIWTPVNIAPQRLPDRFRFEIPRPVESCMFRLSCIPDRGRSELWVAAGPQNRILKYDGITGSYLGDAISGNEVDFPQQFGFGPDGQLYVASAFGNEVLKYDASSGVFLGSFVTNGSGGLNNAIGLAFGPAGELFVGSWGNSAILEFDGFTGNFVRQIASQDVPAGFTGGNDVQVGLNGNLYLSSYGDRTVKAVNLSSLSSVLSTAPGEPLGIGNLTAFAIGPDGDIFAADDREGGGIRKFTGTSGAYSSTLVPDGVLGQPYGVVYASDGLLYVCDSSFNGGVLRFDGQTGAFVDRFVPIGRGELAVPIWPRIIQKKTPTVSVIPSSVSATTGQNVELRSVGKGVGPFLIQWRHNGGVLAGATNSILAIPSVSIEQAGAYEVTIISPYGSARSSAAAVTVTSP